MTVGMRVVLACGSVIAVIAIVLGVLSATSQTNAPVLARPPAPAPTFTPMDGRISVLRAEGYAMVPDQAGALIVADTLAKGDSAWVEARVAAGEAYWLPNGTRVRLLQAEGTVGRVQVMEGQHANRVGWLPVNAVAH